MNDERTKAQLQDELRDRGLPVSGSKAELQQRLQEAEDAEDREPTKAELQDELRELGLPVSGSKAELQQRLDEADEDEADEDGDDAEADDAEAEDAEPEDAGLEDAEPEDADEQPDDDRSRGRQDDGDAATERGSAPSPGRGTLAAGQIARLAARHLGSLTRHTIEGISALARDDEGWRVEVEVVEVSRVPPSTDVLGTYAVWVDRDGELISYERVARFVRGQAGGGDG